MEIPLKGNNKDISHAKMLVLLNRTRKTGTLSVSNGPITKNLYLTKGNVIFASSTYADDRLGEILLKAGKITIRAIRQSRRSV